MPRQIEVSKQWQAQCTFIVKLYSPIYASSLNQFLNWFQRHNNVVGQSGLNVNRFETSLSASVNRAYLYMSNLQ